MEELKGMRPMHGLAIEVAKEAAAQRDQALMLLRAAVASMCESCIKRFMLAFAVSQAV